MSLKVVFVERRDPETSSIERVFNVVGRVLCGWGIELDRHKLRYGNSMTGMLANFFAKKPSAADVYHITGHVHYYALLLPRNKTVLTVHDLEVLNRRRGLRRFLLKRFFYDLPVRRVKYVTVISDHVRLELIAATACDEGKVIVIDNPITIQPEEHEKPFDEKCPAILHVGTTPHKNLPNLILALEGMKCSLKIIGRLGPEILNLLHERSITFENRADVSDEEILAEYRNSDIVSYCTYAEGFGLPIIEAQALSIPLITSNLSPMKEVAGDGAILVDPSSVASIREAISKITSDEQTRLEIVQKGRENIKRFEPSKVAAEYRDLYTRIVSNSHH